MYNVDKPEDFNLPGEKPEFEDTQPSMPAALDGDFEETRPSTSVAPIICDETIAKIMRLLSLPKNVMWFKLESRVGASPTVECGYHPEQPKEQ